MNKREVVHSSLRVAYKSWGGVGLILLLVLILVGCKTETSQRWCLKPSDFVFAQLEQPIPSVGFTNTPLPIAVAEIGGIVDRLTGHQILFRLSSSDDRTVSSLPVTFSGRNISQNKALFAVATVSRHKLLYRDMLIVLAPWTSGEGNCSLTFTGQCIDAFTRKPISQAVISLQIPFERSPRVRVNSNSRGCYALSVQVPASFVTAKVDGQEIIFVRPNPVQVLIIGDAVGYHQASQKVDLRGGEEAYECALEFTSNGVKKLPSERARALIKD